MLKLLPLIGVAFVFLQDTHADCNTEDAPKGFKESIYQFAVDLMKKISQENDNHFVSSPLSIWTVLFLISQGARGDTFNELKTVLKIRGYKCFKNKYLDISNKVTTVHETDVFLEHSSVIFADEAISFTKKYEDEVFRTNVSSLKIINFEDTDTASSTINDYISQATQGTIEEIVTPGDLENVKMLIADALFFKGLWTVPFNSNDTEIKEFFDHKGKKTGDVNMMAGYYNFNVINADRIQAKVLELPYGNGKRHSMLLFLPYKQVPLYSVIEKLNKIGVEFIREQFLQYDEVPSVVVKIPRFKLTSEHNNLKKFLIDMKLKTVFDDSLADLSQMSNKSLHVSNVIQKADIEVTEDGSTAGAASAAEIGWRIQPMEFFAVKPFLFMIIDKVYDIPLFTGAYSKPSLF